MPTSAQDAQPWPTAELSLIIPVCNEEAVLPRTAASLKLALQGLRAEVIYVCNGCTDRSVQILRDIFGDGAMILELELANKAAALNTGDRAARVFPRFYVDADVSFSSATLRRLLEVLNSGEADLVSPRITSDTSRATFLARAVSKTWLALPYARLQAFQCLMGVSASGRACWPSLPELIADDSYMTSCIPVPRRQRLNDVALEMPLPQRFWDWVRVRARWLEGQQEMQAMGRPIPKSKGQTRQLCQRLLDPRSCPHTLAYLSVRLLAAMLCRWAPSKQRTWFQDPSSRKRGTLLSNPQEIDEDACS